jgi:integrase
MIPSKYQFQELKVSITKRILKGGRNVNPDGESRVYIEIIVYHKDGTRKFRRIPTEVFVNPDNWNKKFDGSVSIKDPDHETKNDIINGYYTDYGNQLIKRERGTWVKGFDPKHLVKIDDMFPTTTKKLTDYIEDYITYRKGINTTYNTIKVFKTLKGRIENYEKDQNKTLTFEDITLSFSDSFYSYLLKEDYKTGTIQKCYTQFITVLTHFFERRDEMNLKISDTFKSKRFRRGKKSENEPHPLSHTEFEILKNYTFKTEHLKETQKRFLLQISLGCRYSDLFNITPDKINDNCLTYYPTKTRNKTNNKVVVPLNKISKSILQECNYDTRSLYVSNQKYNDGLDDMFKELIKEQPDTFKEVYTSHDGRDSFITFLIESGCDVPSLLRMVGQESYEMLKRYFKSTTEHITERMNNVQVFN